MFAPRRRAPPPLVIPLYATPIIRRSSPPLPIRRTLYHPYRRERARQPPPPIVINFSLSASASNTGPASAEHSPAESVPASPLTPIQEDTPEAPGAPVTRVVIPLHAIKDLTVANCGWHDAQQTEYQSFARAAIHAYLNIKKTLNAQEQEACNNAIKAIEDKVPSFKNYEGHWGAIVVLKDQLKSQKDIAVKQSKWAAMKKPNTEKCDSLSRTSRSLRAFSHSLSFNL
ncbi:hypothetical protein L218DRAFT_1006777 [Marasmius fiardii PR-910]|nr:hypothetical protein L218DRAFT_1006777 [Marasmius fiardii PR-910]